MSTRRHHHLLLAFTITALLVLPGCRKKDPFSPEVIAHDLEDRPVDALYKEIDRMTFNPPADGRLTDSQLATFIRVNQLADAIAQVARNHSSPDKGGLAFAGKTRLLGTAELRAALMLGENPHEQRWIHHMIRQHVPLIRQYRAFELKIDEATRQSETGTDAFGRVQQLAISDQWQKSLRAWENDQREVDLANTRLIVQHTSELRKWIPELATSP